MTALRQIRAFLLRTATLFRRAQMDGDVAAEIESHLELHVADNLRAGMTATEARRHAVLALGGVEQAKERYRDRRGLPAVEALLQDIRFGARMLRKHPTFTAVAVFTLAIGLGPTTAIFALANWAVLRPVPGVRAPEEVGLFMSGSPTPRGTIQSNFISYPNYRDIASRLHTIALAGHQSLAAHVTAGNGAPRTVMGQFVTASYFDVLGVTMRAGRPLTERDDNPSDPAMVAVVSDSLWASLFDRDRSAVGQTLRVNGHTVTVVGVTAEGFQGIDRVAQSDLWLPGATQSIVTYRGSQSAAEDRTVDAYYQWIGRLAPGASWPQAQAELESLTAWLSEQYPIENGRLQTTRFNFSGPIDTAGVGRRFIPLFAIAMGAMAIVLLITCSNVACLLLIRGVARRDEVATRKALGAGRWRLLRQHVTEGLLLWGLGAVAGGLIAWTATRAVAGASLTTFGIRDARLPVDWRVMVFAAALPLVVGLLFSVLPALKAIRVDVTQTLKQGGGPTATRASFASGSVLTVVQLSAALTLLVGALLLAVTLRHLARVDPGFDADAVTAAQMRPRTVGLDTRASLRFYRDLEERLASQAGVQSVALAAQLPFLGSRWMTGIRRAGEPAESSIDTAVNHVLSPGYFRTLGIRLLHGRTFSAEEIPGPERLEGSALVVVLSESLARGLFGTDDAVGRFVELRGRTNQGRHEVIGVAADVRFFSLIGDPTPILYDPRGASLAASGVNGATLVLRADPVRNSAAEIRRAAAAINSVVPIDVVPLSQAIQRARLEWDVLTWLMLALAGVAIVLSMVGVYGLVAFAAAARRGEFGIRAAFGASPAIIRRLVLRRAVRLAAAGLVFGLAGSYALVQVLESRLVGVRPFDPLIWSIAAAALVAVVVAASLLPARKAADVNPADALRAM